MGVYTPRKAGRCRWRPVLEDDYPEPLLGPGCINRETVRSEASIPGFSHSP